MLIWQFPLSEELVWTNNVRLATPLNPQMLSQLVSRWSASRGKQNKGWLRCVILDDSIETHLLWSDVSRYQLTVYLAPADVPQVQLHGVPRGPNRVGEGARFLQGVLDLHHLLARDQRVSAEVWRGESGEEIPFLEDSKPRKNYLVGSWRGLAGWLTGHRSIIYISDDKFILTFCLNRRSGIFLAINTWNLIS